MFVLLSVGQLYISAVSSGSQGSSVAEGVRRQAAEGLKGRYELPKTGDFGLGIFAEVSSFAKVCGSQAFSSDNRHFVPIPPLIAAHAQFTM